MDKTESLISKIYVLGWSWIFNMLFILSSANNLPNFSLILIYSGCFSKIPGLLITVVVQVLEGQNVSGGQNVSK